YKSSECKSRMSTESLVRQNVKNENVSYRPVIKCYNCLKTGHISRDCPEVRKPQGACFKCGKTGHCIANCSEFKQSLQPSTSQEGTFVALSPSVELEKKYYKSVRLGENIVVEKAFVDTGCSSCLIE